MKKAIVAIALAAMASTAFAAIESSAHDLSSATGPGTYPNGTLSACQYCHAPHNVNPGAVGAPLWNRNASAQTFTPYDSNTLVGTAAVVPNANSMTCLSCHDGATNMGGTYSGSPGFAAATPMTLATSGTRVIGTDLTNDHPVSIPYPASGPFRTVAYVTQTAGLNLYGAAGSETVECGSCHDPHVTGVGIVKFLRASATTICTECHTK